MNKTSQPNKALKILQFPVIRLFIGLGVLTVLVSLLSAGVSAALVGAGPVIELLATILVAALACLAYAGFVRILERRPVTELALSGAPGELAAGALVGALLFAVTIGLIALMGFYRVTGVNAWSAMIPMLSLAVLSGVVEELIIRGVVFRIIEESLGTWLALGISALFFGFLHLGNPNATLWGALAIAIEAGIMLAAAYTFTRRLWLPIGIHFAWNFVQGGVFGVAVSGNGVVGLLQSTLSGPALLSGGEFGAEASIFAVIVCLAAGVYLLWRSAKKGNILKPYWMR